MKSHIGLHEPYIGKYEYKYLLESLHTKNLSVGKNIDSFENCVASMYKSKFAIATSSGTAALHLMAIVSKISSKDIVLIPTLTFAGSAFPFAYVESNIIFVDCDPSNLLIDLNCLEDLLRKLRKTIKKRIHLLTVDLYGFLNDYENILVLCHKYNVNLIIDSAEAFGSLHAKYNLTDICDFVALSFNGNKIVTTAGGGMILTNNQNYLSKFRLLRNQAKKDKPWYEHTELGFNYRMSNVSAGIGLGQLKSLKKILKLKSKIHSRYKTQLAQNLNVQLIDDLPWSNSNYWLNVIKLKDKKTAEKIKNLLALNYFETRPIWKPLHRQPIFKTNKFFGSGNAENLFSRSICLPSGAGIPIKKIDLICSIINDNC